MSEFSHDETLTAMLTASRVVGMSTDEQEYWSHRYRTAVARESYASPSYEKPEAVEAIWRSWIEKWPSLPMELRVLKTKLEKGVLRWLTS